VPCSTTNRHRGRRCVHSSSPKPVGDEQRRAAAVMANRSAVMASAVAVSRCSVGSSRTSTGKSASSAWPPRCAGARRRDRMPAHQLVARPSGGGSPTPLSRPLEAQAARHRVNRGDRCAGCSPTWCRRCGVLATRPIISRTRHRRAGRARPLRGRDPRKRGTGARRPQWRTFRPTWSDDGQPFAPLELALTSSTAMPSCPG